MKPLERWQDEIQDPVEQSRLGACQKCTGYGEPGPAGGGVAAADKWQGHQRGHERDSAHITSAGSQHCDQPLEQGEAAYGLLHARALVAAAEIAQPRELQAR